MIEAGAGGRICLMGSTAGYRGLPTAPAYSGTKAAVIAMGESLKPELDHLGLVLQVACPGFVKSEASETNAFPMPMLMETEDAAQAFYRGLTGAQPVRNHLPQDLRPDPQDDDEPALLAVLQPCGRWRRSRVRIWPQRNRFGSVRPRLLGGCADLSPTALRAAGPSVAQFHGANVNVPRQNAERACRRACPFNCAWGDLMQQHSKHRVLSVRG